MTAAARKQRLKADQVDIINLNARKQAAYRLRRDAGLAVYKLTLPVVGVEHLLQIAKKLPPDVDDHATVQQALQQLNEDLIADAAESQLI
jgi:hypothetical protein